MKKRFLLFLFIAISAFGYYKYTKYKREALIKRRIAQIQNIDQGQLASILDRVQKTKKQIKTTGLIKPKRVRRLRPKKRKTHQYQADDEEAYNNNDEDTDDEELDEDEEDTEDDEDTPKARPMRGRFKPISPAALKRIREAAKERMKQLLDRENNDENDDEEEEED